MKSWILLVVTVVGITALGTVLLAFLPDAPVESKFPAPSKADGPPPVAEVEGDLVYQFGVMAQDSPGKHSWTIKNSGKGPLQVTLGHTDCSCTVAKLAPKKNAEGVTTENVTVSVEPGKTEPIDVEWNTRQINGAYRKTATIITNDPEHPEIKLAVEGKVFPAVSIRPSDSTVQFLTVPNSDIHERKIAVYSNVQPDFRITRMAVSNSDLLAVSSKPLTPDEAKALETAGGYQVTVTLQKTGKIGPFAEEMVLETDIPSKPRMALAVLGKLEGPVTLLPEKIRIRGITTSSGGSQEMTIWARLDGETKFEVARKPKELEIAFEPVALPAGTKGTKTKMIVKVPPGTANEHIDEDIILKTSNPLASEIRVPVDILIRASE
jgi:hypothetical protein